MQESFKRNTIFCPNHISGKQLIIEHESRVNIQRVESIRKFQPTIMSIFEICVCVMLLRFPSYQTFQKCVRVVSAKHLTYCRPIKAT